MTDINNDYENYANAKRNGLRFYKGKPCGNHPDAPRYTISKGCTQCAKDRRKQSVANNPHYERDIKRRQTERLNHGHAITPLSGAPIFEELL